MNYGVKTNTDYLLPEGFLLAHELFPNGGTCLEFGVGWGDSMEWQLRQLITNYKNSNIIGFDSWQGLPQETEGVWYPERHSKGAFANKRKDIEKRLRDILKIEIPHPQLRFVDGFYSDSLTDEVRATINNVIFINVDVDIHISTIQVLNFVKPLLQVNTIIYFDDWKDPKDTFNGEWGEHLAFKQWCDENPNFKFETLNVNVYNQRYMKVIEI